MLLGGAALISLLSALGVCLGGGHFDTLAWLWILPVTFLGSFLLVAALVFAFVYVMIERIRLDVPQEEDSPFYRTLANLVVDALRVVIRLHIHTTGMEQVPKEGRFMLVCNHINDTDPVILLHCFRKNQLAFISKRENDKKFLVGKLMHKLLCQPINRENDREALKTILKCIQILKEDKASIAVFPEGYTSMDGKLHPFRHGVFKIAQKARVPVVVCTIQGSQPVIPNIFKLKSSHVQVHLLKVIPPEEFQGITAVELGNRVHALMAEDLGPDQVLQETT